MRWSFSLCGLIPNGKNNLFTFNVFVTLRLKEILILPVEKWQRSMDMVLWLILRNQEWSIVEKLRWGFSHFKQTHSRLMKWVRFVWNKFQLRTFDPSWLKVWKFTSLSEIHRSGRTKVFLTKNPLKMNHDAWIKAPPNTSKTWHFLFFLMKVSTRIIFIIQLKAAWLYSVFAM